MEGSAEPFWLRSASAMLTSSGRRSSTGSSEGAAPAVAAAEQKKVERAESHAQAARPAALHPLLEALLDEFRVCDAKIGRLEEQAALAMRSAGSMAAAA